MKKLILLFLLIPFVVLPQTPNGTTGVSITTSFVIPSGLDPGTFTDGNPYDFVVIDPSGPTVIETVDFIYDDTNGNTLNLLNPLLYNTTYEWGVWADGDDPLVDPVIYGPYSFTTLLATPLLVGPVDAATGVSINPSLSWTLDASTSDVVFYIDCDDDGELAIDKLTVGPFGASPQSIGPLAYNTTYIWQVRAVVSNVLLPNDGEESTSLTSTFTTEIATPVLTAPANAASGQSITPTFTWTLAGGTGGVTYDLQYHTGGGFPGTTVAGVTSGHNTTVFVYGTTYTWRIVAKKAGEADKPSSSRTFTTGNPNLLASVANPSQGNYAVGISVLPTFTWLASAGATSYDLEVSTDPAFGSLVSLTGRLAIAGLTYTVQPFEQLNSGTLYYWRVLINGGVNDGIYSNSWEFTTHNGNLNFTTYYPYGTSVNLAWLLLPYTANVKYDLYYSDDGFLTYTTVPNLTNTFYTLTGLATGTTYDVIVRAKNNAGTVIISYSAAVSFTTDGLPTPYLSFPIGGATTYSNPPYLYWYTGTLFSGQYLVRYATNSSVDGNGELNHGSAANLALTSNLFTVFPAPLTPGQTYYWQVQCYDGVNYGPWSSVESFVVYSSTPTVAPVPYPSWPVGGYDYYLNPPTFFWYTGTFTTGLHFQVQWDDASNFATPLGTSGWFASNLYYTLGAALPPGTYWWRVRSSIDGGTTWSAWSTAESFVIPSATSSVSVPYPTAPVGTIVATLNPTMSWFALTPPALEYRVRISPYSSVDGNGMLNHVTAQSSGWTSSTSIAYNSLPSAPSALIAGVTYYWQVQSRLAAPPNTVSSWSYVVSFETAAGATAIIPLVVSPIQGQPINSTSAILTWALPGQPQSHLKYDVEYSKNADFTNAVKISGVNEPVAKIDGLDKNSKYYWRVSSKNNSGSQSLFSSVGSFSTGNITSVEPEHQVIPANFVLAQNYPNPFNPTTSITYSIPKDNFVSIKIYDMLGREVATLVNDYKNAGNHTINWNGEDNSGQKVASGTYIYRITAGNFVATKKMVLLK